MTTPGHHRPMWRRLTLALASVVSVAVVAGVSLVYAYASYQVDKVATVHHLVHLKPRVHYDDPFTVLMVGTDSRTGKGNHYGGQACNCSDTMILARVDPKHQAISLLSIPRDSYVHLDGLDVTGKLNAAFTRGPDNLIQTIEDDFGIPINHYVLVDFAAFKDTVKALGGVRMDVPMPIKDKNAHLDIEHTGCQTLGPDQALALGRARELKYEDADGWHYDPTWEYGRQRRQQVFLKTLAEQIVSRGLSDPAKANNVVNTITGAGVKTDDAVTTAELVSLAQQFGHFHAQHIKTWSLPTYTQEHTPGWGDVEVLHADKDIETILAWYGASVPAQGVTLPAAGVSTPVHPTPAAPRPASSSHSPEPKPSSSSAHDARDLPPTSSTPRPWDPRPCGAAG